MKLLINTSSREKNCYKILNDIKEKDDYLISLSNKNIKACRGCGNCKKHLDEFCIIKDEMHEIYEKMAKAKKIVIATPVYYNFFNGTLKNIIDRTRPQFSHTELIKSKEVYLILIGAMSEEENKDVIDMINSYFMGIAEFMEFNFHFAGYISSGDIESVDDIEKNNINYTEILKRIKNSIN